MKSIIQKSAVMTVALLSFLTVSAYDFEANGLYYYILSTKDLTCGVTFGDNPYSGDVTIPSSVTFSGKNLTVTNIFGSAFKNCPRLTSIDLPNSLTGIGSNAFDGCTGLTSIDLPNSLTGIGDYAFYGCTGLTSIDLPNSLTGIGDYAFYGCTALTSIDLPNSLTGIGRNAFDGCTGLTSIDLPNSLTGIGDYAFYGCTGLTSIDLPNSLTRIGDYAFKGCTGLTSIDLPNSLTGIGRNAFRGCTGLTSIDFPNSLTGIGDYAFKGCTGLTSIDLPNSLTGIEYSAFEGCTGLTSINLPSSQTEIWEMAFAECSNLTTAVIFSDIPGGCFYDDVSLESLTVMAGKSIKFYTHDYYYTFQNVSLKELKINPGDTPDMELHTSDLDSWTRDLQRLYMGGHVRDFQDRRLRFTIPNIQQIFIDESITDISDDFDNLSTCTNLSYIQCNGLTPPETKYIFSNLQYAQVQLVVPDNALDSYKNHPIWGNFWNITDISGLPNTHENATSKVEIGRYDIHSRPVTKEFHGFVIVRYSDGSTQKILQ